MNILPQALKRNINQQNGQVIPVASKPEIPAEAAQVMASINKMQQERDDLRFQVNEMKIEIEVNKSRILMLEKDLEVTRSDKDYYQRYCTSLHTRLSSIGSQIDEALVEADANGRKLEQRNENTQTAIDKAVENLDLNDNGEPSHDPKPKDKW